MARFLGLACWRELNPWLWVVLALVGLATVVVSTLLQYGIGE